MKNSPLKTLFLWILTIIAIGTLALWVYLVFQVYSIKKDINFAKSEIDTTTGRQSYMVSVSRALRDMGNNLGSIENRFITEDEVPTFIEFLENEADLYEVKASFNGIAIDPLSKNATFRILKAQISASGSWDNLISFVHSLDTMEYASRVEKVSFSKSGNGSEWSAVIDISQNIK